MTKTIAELWHGNLEPIRFLGQSNSEMRRLEGLMLRHLENLEETLNESVKAVFEKYHDCVEEYLSLTGEQAFCDGFCLGMRFAAEALSGAEQIV